MPWMRVRRATLRHDERLEAQLLRLVGHRQDAVDVARRLMGREGQWPPTRQSHKEPKCITGQEQLCSCPVRLGRLDLTQPGVVGVSAHA
jgi:hypothetical protein